MLLHRRHEKGRSEPAFYCVLRVAESLLVYGGLVGSCRLRALRVTAVHIDVIEQLASLVHVHFRIDVSDMRLRGVGRNDSFSKCCRWYIRVRCI